jgi:outer membrane lipoprotein LolB
LRRLARSANPGAIIRHLREKFGLAWVLAILLVLPACAPRAIRPAAAPDLARAEQLLSERESLLFERDRFDLAGRIAISDGKDGGSGRFDWQQRGAAYSLRFAAPVTARSWRLEAQPGQALLIESNGAVRVANTAEELLQRELRWHLPSDSLRYWVLGMRAPGAESDVEFDEEGQLALLRQSGWEIRYVQFDGTHNPPLPRKLFARSGEHQVRISVRKWTFVE